MKMAPVISAISKLDIDNILVHTGQHYDKNMSKVFFEELGLPDPDNFLGVGSSSHASQTAKILIEFEKQCLKRKPSLVVVAGDVNSTLACALVAVKLNIPVAHVEAGLRSFDNTMPEEINRILTDRISDLLFTTEDSGTQNLINEGVPKEKIHFVGNCMIDSVTKFIPLAKEMAPWSEYGLNRNDYCLITLHRPSNVDSRKDIVKIVTMLNRMSEKIHIVFPVHPRTQKSIKNCSITLSDNIRLLDPLPYIEFLGLMSNAKLVVTDSGGIQEETTYLNIQCLTIRNNTERPVTVEAGTNHLVGTDPEKVMSVFHRILNGTIKKGHTPQKWDGKAGQRIAEIIRELYC
jgi:UDP-N-acetylglucosamine 2-epimerase (non-hydrolysing)